jgi:aminodeoxyfutalosine deaminase
MPKVELHRHLEGSLRPGFLLELAARNRLRLPFEDVATYDSLLSFGGFDDFIPPFLLGVTCLRRPSDFTDAVVELGEQLHAEGVVYAEVTYTPQFYQRLDPGFSRVLEALNAGRRRVHRRRNIEIRWIPDLVRNRPEPARAVVDWLTALDPGESGVVALGLGGPERGYPSEPFAELFRRAAAAGLPANPHCGETAGPESVRETCEALRPRRIGHGVRAAEDPELLARLVRDEITFEVCLSSNLALRHYDSLDSHPLTALLDADCRVTLNTDDPVLFRTDLPREYRLAASLPGVHGSVLHRLASNALESSYLPEPQKAAYRERLDDWRQADCRLNPPGLAAR